MFKSLRTKIIFTAIVLFLLGIFIMTFMINDQVKKRSVERIVSMSESTVQQVGGSINNYFEQYSKGIELLSGSDIIASYKGQDEDKAAEKELLSELKNFLTIYLDSSAAYYSTTTTNKLVIIYPVVELNGLDVNSRA